MLVFVARRLAGAVLLLFVMTLITFVMFFVMPADSRNAQRNERGFGLQTQFNIRGSFPEQYARFLGHIVLHGDLGKSTSSDRPVTTVIRRTLPVTLSLMVGGAIIWLTLAFPIGLLSALRPRSLLDKGLMLFVLVGLSAHPVWLSLIFSYVFGVRLHWFPVAGYCDLFYNPGSSNLCGGPRYWAYHLFLPWLTFAFLFAALYARMIRATVLEAMDEDYVRTARAKGAGTVRVMRGHVLRNAMLPVITMLGMDVGIAFGGALFIETIFQLPGMGALLVLSLAGSDLPVILGIVLTISVAVVIANLIVNILYCFIDPRVRLSGKGDAITASPALARQLRARPRMSESATSS